MVSSCRSATNTLCEPRKANFSGRHRPGIATRSSRRRPRWWLQLAPFAFRVPRPPRRSDLAIATAQDARSDCLLGAKGYERLRAIRFPSAPLAPTLDPGLNPPRKTSPDHLRLGRCPSSTNFFFRLDPALYLARVF